MCFHAGSDLGKRDVGSCGGMLPFSGNFYERSQRGALGGKQQMGKKRGKKERRTMQEKKETVKITEEAGNRNWKKH